MKFLLRSLLVFGVVFCSAGTAFGKLVEVNLHFVWMRVQDASEPLYVQFGEHRKLEGAFRSLSPKPQKYRGTNPIPVYRKTGDRFEEEAEIVIPSGVRDAAVIFVVDPEAHEGELRFRPCVLDLKKNSGRGGDVFFANLSDLTLRGKANDSNPVKCLSGETQKLYSLPAGAQSESLGFKIVAAANSPEAAKKSWRYSNAMRVQALQCYFLVALPGPAADPGKPPRCELISLREERK